MFFGVMRGERGNEPSSFCVLSTLFNTFWSTAPIISHWNLSYTWVAENVIWSQWGCTGINEELHWSASLFVEDVQWNERCLASLSKSSVL